MEGKRQTNSSVYLHPPSLKDQVLFWICYEMLQGETKATDKQGMDLFPIA